MTREEIIIELNRLSVGCIIHPITTGHLWWKKIIGYNLSAKPYYWFNVDSTIAKHLSVGIDYDFSKIILRGDGTK